MPQEIFDLAKQLSEASAKSHLAQINYRAALAHEEDVREYLSSALRARQVSETIAIALPASKVLICTDDGEGGYEFIVVTSFK